MDRIKIPIIKDRKENQKSIETSRELEEQTVFKNNPIENNDCKHKQL